MNKQRLLALADYLESRQATKNTKFDMGSWFRASLESDTVEKTQIKDGKVVHVREGFCKTSACMLGHAALNPEFNKLGLTLEVHFDSLDSGEVAGGTIKYRGYDDEDAGAKFFGLTSDEAEALFFNYDIATAKQGAQLIRDWVAGRKKIVNGHFEDVARR